jgi:N-acetylmuramoyl-L-alanine amidase
MLHTLHTLHSCILAEGGCVITLPRLTPYNSDIMAPSPNHGARRAPMIQGIVLHATEDDGDEALSLSWMRSPKSQVSCHLYVSRTGRVTRLVGDQQRAWHAGVAWWRGTSDVNSITLGIEIANRNDGEPFTNAQYRRVADIVTHYCQQGLSLDDVVGHCDIAPDRRTDPLGWDWHRLRRLVRHELRTMSGHSRRPMPVPLPDARSLAPSKEALPDAPIIVAGFATPKPNPPKPILHSRTVWINGLTVLASGGLLAGDALDLAQRIGIVLPEELTKWALFGVGLVNIILRMGTSGPLACRLTAQCSSSDDSGDQPDESPAITHVQPAFS